MIDWVLLDRMRHALEHSQTLDVDVPQEARADYYRELVWLGYPPTAITLALGWNAKRIQTDIRQRAERRTPPPQSALPRYTQARRIEVDTRPGAVILTIDSTPHIIEDTPDALLKLGRLIYGAASAQHEDMTA